MIISFDRMVTSELDLWQTVMQSDRFNPEIRRAYSFEIDKQPFMHPAGMVSVFTTLAPRTVRKFAHCKEWLKARAV